MKYGVDWIRTYCANEFVSYEGNTYVVIKDFNAVQPLPLLGWKCSIPVQANARYHLWLEHEIAGGIHASIHFRQWENSSRGGVLHEWTCPIDDTQPILLEIGEHPGTLSLTLVCEGSGAVRIGTLHVRNEMGQADGWSIFEPGGTRYVTENGLELFAWYTSGKKRAPLNVIFTDYTNEENYDSRIKPYLNGTPMLTFLDPRLTGGVFYLGSDEYEDMIERAIRQTLTALQLDSSEVMFWGTSMGAYAALYYGLLFSPRAIFLEKPILNLLTSSETWAGDRVKIAAELLDVKQYFRARNPLVGEKIWNRLADNRSKRMDIVVTAVDNDELDHDAYQDLIDKTKDSQMNVYGKIISAHHVDETPITLQWLVVQYRRYIEAFEREDDGRDWS